MSKLLWHRRLTLQEQSGQTGQADRFLFHGQTGHAKAAELLISSEMIRHEAAAHALVYASCRGFVEIVSILIKACSIFKSFSSLL